MPNRKPSDRRSNIPTGIPTGTAAGANISFLRVFGLKGAGHSTPFCSNTTSPPSPVMSASNGCYSTVEKGSTPFWVYTRRNRRPKVAGGGLSSDFASHGISGECVTRLLSRTAMANAPYPQLYYSLISCLRLLPVEGSDIIIPNMLWCQGIFWGWGASPGKGWTEGLDFGEVVGEKKVFGRDNASSEDHEQQKR